MTGWLQLRPTAIGGGMVASYGQITDSLLVPAQAIVERPSAGPGSPDPLPCPAGCTIASLPAIPKGPRVAAHPPQSRLALPRRHPTASPRAPPPMI
ncbi:hypothetical protein [Paracoccus spongiarum]|uniref:Uncharacterized protein n=1 Tax=Paracoccus spongiarum TaxID=3064387 RepID=A0ABT9JCM1_9RHOB|nr:hypothetical protein [Paracoccus sp. 2205BS29-5]MDP5307552.1 hypothetical protein [Paracoccus sp. 2205BS29-5]